MKAFANNGPTRFIDPEQRSKVFFLEFQELQQVLQQGGSQDCSSRQWNPVLSLWQQKTGPAVRNFWLPSQTR